MSAVVGWELHPWCQGPGLLEAPVCVLSRSRGHRQIKHWVFQALEVIHANSTHMSLAKANYRAMPNAKGQRSPLLPCRRRKTSIFTISSVDLISTLGGALLLSHITKQDRDDEKAELHNSKCCGLCFPPSMLRCPIQATVISAPFHSSLSSSLLSAP